METATGYSRAFGKSPAWTPLRVGPDAAAARRRLLSARAVRLELRRGSPQHCQVPKALPGYELHPISAPHVPQVRLNGMNAPLIRASAAGHMRELGRLAPCATMERFVYDLEFEYMGHG